MYTYIGMCIYVKIKETEARDQRIYLLNKNNLRMTNTLYKRESTLRI